MPKLKIDINADSKQSVQEAKKLEAALKKIGTASKESNPGLDELTKSVKKLGAAYLTLRSVKFIANQAEIAAQAEATRMAFDNLAKGAGESSSKILNALRAASKGAVSDMDLIQAAARSASLGIGFQDQIKLMKIASATSKATGQTVTKAFDDVTLAVGRGSKLILDNLGIILDVEKANEDYAASIGKTASQLNDAERKQAFMNATLKAGAELTEKIGVETKTTSENFATLKANIRNTSDSIAKYLLPTFNSFAETLNQSGPAVKEMIRVFLKGRDATIKTGESVGSLGEAWDKMTKTIDETDAWSNVLEINKEVLDASDELRRMENAYNESIAKGNVLRDQRNLLNNIGIADMDRYKGNLADVKVLEEDYNAGQKLAAKAKKDRWFKNNEDIVKNEEATANAILSIRAGEAEETKALMSKNKEEWEANAEEIASAFGQGFGELIAQTKNFEAVTREVTKNVLVMISQIIAKKAAAKITASIFTNSAKGNVFENGRQLQRYAKGTVISSPTVFPMANGGTGLAGEAGPEGILPLKRTSTGELGVKSENSGQPLYITFHVNALDGRSFAEYVRTNKEAIIGPITDAIQKGDRGMNSAIRMAAKG